MGLNSQQVIEKKGSLSLALVFGLVDKSMVDFHMVASENNNNYDVMTQRLSFYRYG